MPDINPTDPCFNLSKPYVPGTATRKDDLPNNNSDNFTLIALVPWVSGDCTMAYINGAHADTVSAFVFYLLNNDTGLPPTFEGGQWTEDNAVLVSLSNTAFPLYAVPGYLGVGMMNALSKYSGNVSSVPNGSLLLDQYHLDESDYVRVLTQIDLPASSSSSNLPGLWIFFFVFIGGVVLMSLISLAMHILQLWRRRNLRRRIASGDVNLETLGIKRLTVPQKIIDKMPQFIYTCKAEDGAVAENQDITASTKDDPTIEQTSSSQTEAPVKGTSLTAHDYLPHSQPTCPICLDDFVSGSTTIRELPCLHVFHPECIDTFLSKHSSLCPMCKKSSLPVGYCPTEITNPMVVRERALRRQQARNLPDGEGGQTSRSQNPRAALHRSSRRAQPEVANPQPAHQAYTGGVAIEMQPVIDMEAPRPREANPGMSRAEIAQIRARELLGGSDTDENDGSATRPRCKLLPLPHHWVVSSLVHYTARKILRRLFPGFG